MDIISGKSVSDRIAAGKLFFLNSAVASKEKRVVANGEIELERFEKAKKAAEDEIDKLALQTENRSGSEEAEIFAVHRLMLDDDDFIGPIRKMIIDERVNAEYAVWQSADALVAALSASDDEYTRGRAADVRDIAQSLFSALGSEEQAEALTEKAIICAEELAPSQTIRLDRNLVLGFVTEKGSLNSHTAILAKSMNIPAIVNAKGILNEKYDGKTAVLDGTSGAVYIEPDEETLKRFNASLVKLREDDAALQRLAGRKTFTANGKRVFVCANISNIRDLKLAAENGADGIGLFRSEFLYLESNDYPDEDSQFAAYKAAVEKMDGKNVTIRTLDIGADKKIGYFGLPNEDNPALGFRAIRICLARPQMFKTQLRAILRASRFGKLEIMLPMITSLTEVERAKTLIEEAKSELRTEKIGFDESLRVGIMIETPAAAVISDILAKNVDFFSIGTNDLIQYTLASDRQNPLVESTTDNKHEAVLRLIAYVCDSAGKNKIRVGICGELASDRGLTETFLKMGVDELSVSPSEILRLRKKISEINL